MRSKVWDDKDGVKSIEHWLLRSLVNCVALGIQSIRATQCGLGIEENIDLEAALLELIRRKTLYPSSVDTCLCSTHNRKIHKRPLYSKYSNIYIDLGPSKGFRPKSFYIRLFIWNIHSIKV